jgi:hypothetical protein
LWLGCHVDLTVSIPQAAPVFLPGVTATSVACNCSSPRVKRQTGEGLDGLWCAWQTCPSWKALSFLIPNSGNWLPVESECRL